jgi:exodeoxyribonuclease V alpha subunit
MRIGPLGTEALNEHLQALLNPNGEKGPVIGAKAVVRTGDRVIQTKNNYQVPGYFLNGQQGIVESHGVDWVSIRLDDGRTLRLQGRQMLKLRLAWAITVHRAQGSEFPYVITMYDMSHARMLEKALLYTAITRARKVGIIIGEMEALALTRRRAHRARPRYSALADRLRAAVRAALEATVGAGDDAGVF